MVEPFGEVASGELIRMIRCIGFLGACAVSLVLSGGSSSGQTGNDRLAQLLEKTASPDPDEQIIAILQLVEFEDHPDQLIHPLLRAMIANDTRVGEAAEIAAHQLGETLAAYCDQLLDSDELEQVRAAAEMIHRLGNVAVGSAPKLVHLIRSGDPLKLRLGVYGLVNLKNQDPDVIEAIGTVLDTSDFRDQVLACRAIVTIGPPAICLSGKLKALVETGNVSARSHAMMALGAIGLNDDFDVVELLAGHLNQFLQPDRDRALIGLMYLGPKAVAAKDQVEALMMDEAKFVPCQAALTYWAITGDTERTVQRLIELNQLIDFEFESLHALWQMKSAAASAAEFVAGHLDHEDGSIRSLSVEILENIGSAALPWQSKLETMAEKDLDPLVRYYCQRALRGLASNE
jgi:hypothetical protein